MNFKFLLKHMNLEEPIANLCYIHVRRGGKVLRAGATVTENQAAINENRRTIVDNVSLPGDTKKKKKGFGFQTTCSNAE